MRQFNSRQHLIKLASASFLFNDVFLPKVVGTGQDKT